MARSGDGCVSPRAPACSGKGTRPLIYWYPGPLPPWTGESNWRFKFLRHRLAHSMHATEDGSWADFFFMSNPNAASCKMVREMVAALAHRWPHWNRTAGAGKVRHFMLTPCDHGPGDCAYDRSWIRKKGVLPPELVPSNPARLIGFLTPSGSPGPFSFFLRGVDIRLPQDDDHNCGPICASWKREKLFSLYTGWKSSCNVTVTFVATLTDGVKGDIPIAG